MKTYNEMLEEAKKEVEKLPDSSAKAREEAFQKRKPGKQSRPGRWTRNGPGSSEIDNQSL